MTQREEEFIVKVEKHFEEMSKKHYRLRKFLLSVISALFAAIVFIVWTNTKTATANEERSITNREVQLELRKDVVSLKKDYVDVFMFQKLCNSFEQELNILLQIDREKIKTVEEVRRLFNEARMDVLFDIKPSNTRSGGGSPQTNKKSDK